MVLTRVLWRLVGGAAALTFLVLIVLCVLGYAYLSWKLDKSSVSNKVVGLPLPVQMKAGLPSYTGPHPSVLSRVEDTYSYPIAIGEVGPHLPLYSGPLQYPFYCRTSESGLGQPMVDNQQGIGVPVYKEIKGRITGQVVGYSKDCLVPTQASYFYNRVGGDHFYPLKEAEGDIAKIDINGQSVDFIVRVETGTINRFSYVIAALKGPEGSLALPDGDYWNKRLIYQFRGGVGIGKVQGRISSAGLLKRRVAQLRQGYAVAYSSANQTSNHYNIWIAEETAMRVKSQFRSLYGDALYTVGVGGSGGAIQQYLIAQNRPGLIDAAIPLYSYPDMITQTQYVFDCELLEYYFDVVASDNPRWRFWEERTMIEGTSASTEFYSPRALLYDLAMLFKLKRPHLYSGSNECVSAWRGLTQLVNNPRYVYHSDRYDQGILESEHWSYWDDIKYFLGTDNQGYARQTWDNVGVQYGLDALKNGLLSPEEFLHLNANIGSWRPPSKMRPERYWKLGGVGGLFKFSPWGHHNMELSADGGQTPAKRTLGDVKAMEAAYRSGQVFIGKANIPIVDVRHYLDDELDMHHSFASLSSRKRMLNGQGFADNQLIWVTRRPHDPVPDAFSVVDQWMLNITRSPERSVGKNKPVSVSDRCYDGSGRLIAQGEDVWDGKWNDRPDGQCVQVYPPYRESRMVAGAPFSGDTFKCASQTINNAIAAGVYGAIEIEAYKAELTKVFPAGVCDYTKPDVGRPLDLLALPDQIVPLRLEMVIE